MSDIIYPDTFSMWAREPGVLRTYVSDITSPNPNDCPNCGGMGVMSILCVKEGPYETPPHPYSDKSSHFADGSWWVGTSLTATCPVCHGSCRKNPPKQQYPTQKILGGMFVSQRDT